MMWPQRTTQTTVELRALIDSGVKLWDFEYPSFYKGEEKAAFEQKVIDHFYMRQIGAETVGRFLHYFRRTVREIMPLYIQRYESVEMMKDPEIRPLDNYNMIEEFEEDSSHDVKNTSELSGNQKDTGTSGETTQHIEAVSDTPQGELPISFNTEVDGLWGNLGYASQTTSTLDNHSGNNTNETTSSTNGNDTSVGTGKTSHKLTRRGNIGVTTYSQLLEGYRETFLNIDMEVIRELEVCFLGVE